MSLFGRFFKGKSDLATTTEQPAQTTKTSIPVVKADPSQVTEAVKADLWQAISQTVDIPEESAKLAYEVALRTAVTRDLFEMTEALISLGIQKQRATWLSLWLANRASALMTRDKRIELGITEAIWQYSGAPCRARNSTDEEPKCRDEAHRLADGQKYKIADGLNLNGKNTWPGYEPDCKCVSKSVLPF